MRTLPDSTTLKLAQKKPLNAGALHTILADGAWTPERAEMRMKNADGACVLCVAPKAGFEHIWWECPALNGVVNVGLQKIKHRRAKEGNKPACFWSTDSQTWQQHK
eukprot:15672237-Heterocapsa_arctica.AAC.1